MDKREYANGTWCTVNEWGTYKKAKILCSDGILRTAFNISEPDTFFSVPCSVKVKGVSVRGFMSFDYINGYTTLLFTSYEYCKNDFMLPEWDKMRVGKVLANGSTV